MDGAELHHKDEAEGRKVMTAKRYLSQVHRLRRQIRALEEQIEFLTNKAQGVKAVEYKTDKVDASPADTFAEVMVELAETTNRFSEKVLARRAHGRTRQRVAHPERGRHPGRAASRGRDARGGDRYSSFTLFRIAREMHMSEDRVKHLHLEALAAFQKKYLADEG